MSVRYGRTIHYTDEGKDSTFTENAESISEALEREIKFVVNQQSHSKGRKIAWIRIWNRDKEE
jgi:hypothetical protein